MAAEKKLTKRQFENRYFSIPDEKKPDLVCVVDVAGEGGPDNVGFLVNDLDDVRPDLVGLVLYDGGV